MFEGVVNRHLLERAARRSAYSVGATAVETLVIVGMVVVTARMAARPRPPPLVEVQFIRSVARPPPPPAAAPPARPASAARSAPRPAGAAVVSTRPRAPMALIQPREVADEMKPPDPSEPIEDYGDDAGVEGGVIGGIPGYVPDAAPSDGANAAFARAEQSIEEAPQYATRGFRPPAEAEPGCVRSMVRFPAALAGYVSAPVVVKFAVTRTGALGDIQFMTPLADPRIGDVIRNALRACRWIAGSDAQGRATALWVVMPFRFEAG